MATRLGAAHPQGLQRTIRAECANWSRRGCLFGRACVDGGEKCRWCEESILPTHPELGAAYERATAQARFPFAALIASDRRARVRGHLRRPAGGRSGTEEWAGFGRSTQDALIPYAAPPKSTNEGRGRRP
jgi:hypothetical protein